VLKNAQKEREEAARVKERVIQQQSRMKADLQRQVQARKEQELQARAQDKESFIQNVARNDSLIQKEQDRRQQIKNNYLLNGADMLSQLQRREQQR
jgi:hypothetical protein